MPSESVAGFLDRAKASRVLFPEQVEQLIRQPDMPHSDIASLCEYFLARGVLTQFQVDAIREGRLQDLSYAGYPVIDKIGPFPGGTAYRAMHPSLRTPLVLRRYDAGAFAPTDDPKVVVERARIFGMLAHSNMLPLLDAGLHEGQAYAVLDQPADSADLASLFKDVGGAMPAFLAAEYGWAIASVLRAVHERGGWHGEVCPGLLVVGPVTAKARPDGPPKRRPAPNATVKLAETGLIPKRPALLPMALPVGPEESHAAPVPQGPTDDVIPYLSPERLDTGTYAAAGDIYGLGASLYLLLSGRAPFAAENHDALLNKIRSSDPVALATLRPDVPGELAAVVMRMLAKKPADRPATASEVCEALAPFCRAGVLPSAPRPVAGADPKAVPVVVHQVAPQAELVAEELPAEDEGDGWGVNPSAFAEAHAASASDTTPRKRRGEMTDEEKRRSKLWMLVGLCLHLTAVTLLICWAAGVFSSSPAPSNNQPDPEPKEKKVTPKRFEKKKEQG
jgi:hypothetical protein